MNVLPKRQRKIEIFGFPVAKGHLSVMAMLRQRPPMRRHLGVSWQACCCRLPGESRFDKFSA